ncbi:toll/interleukin-1 receptor domain-containing protein [Clavibacter michiganensis subsp. phaseoli]|uniref:toll/interleukin-1 receptor domain-containing protein n=1 Tax=Clavibacter phaseoli TaxID=1734031 RepID=UPI001FB2FABE|nr:toll/interleukin-1 receptor domain-containing protein [Clavibacter phaseoli]MCJ1710749.1 toll/interleukin-1 receptor domain-containing protein [Clavibacter phaseoli]
MIDALDGDQDWDFRRTNLLLIEYGCETVGGYGNEDFTFADSIKNVPDADLLEIYELITGSEPNEVRGQIEDAESSLWKRGYVRVFLSHSAQHKQFVGQIANELAVSGIHAFVAHDTMEFEQPWQEQIERGLRSMQAFVAVVHPEFLSSAWCQQEVGWALGRGVPKYVIRYPADPTGFIGRTQWPQGNSLSAKEVAALILRWVSNVPEFSDQIIDGLLAALRASQNYMDAGATARRIATMDTLTPQQWTRLGEIYHSNDQVGHAGLVGQALAPYYRNHGQTWPPAAPMEPDPF